MRSTSAKTALAAALAALAVVAGCGGHKTSQPATTRAADGLHGLLPQPLPRKPGFVLTDTHGRTYDFRRATRGKLTYLYFGYTNCPDTCPLTMADIAAAFRQEPAFIRNKVDVVFVTVDPRRDTRRALRHWLDHFDSSFVGLTGSRARIAAAEHAAGVPLAAPEEVKGAGYSVAHSTLVIPYSPDGRAHVVYAQGFHAADYAHDMPLLLRYSR